MSDTGPSSPLPHAFSEDILSSSSISDSEWAGDWTDVGSAAVSSAASDSDTDDEHDHQSEIDSVVESVDSSWDSSSTDESGDSETDEENPPAVNRSMTQPSAASSGEALSQPITTNAHESQVSEAISQSLSPTLELSREYRSLTLSSPADTIRRRRLPSSSNSHTPTILSGPNSIQLTFPDPLTASDPTRTHSLLKTEPTIIQEVDETRESSFASTVPETTAETVSLPNSLSSMDFSSAVLSLAPSSASPLHHALQIIVLGSSESSLYLKEHLLKYVLRCATRAVSPGSIYKEVLTQETLCARSRAYAVEQSEEGQGNMADTRTSVLVLDCSGRALETPDMAPDGTPTLVIFLLTSAHFESANLMSMLNVPPVAKFLPVLLPSADGVETNRLMSQSSSSPSLWVDVPGSDSDTEDKATKLREAQLIWDGIGRDKSLLLHGLVEDDIVTLSNAISPDGQVQLVRAIDGLVHSRPASPSTAELPLELPLNLPLKEEKLVPEPINLFDQHRLVRIIPYLNTPQGRTLSFALSLLALFVGSIALHSISPSYAQANASTTAKSGSMVSSPQALWNSFFAVNKSQSSPILETTSSPTNTFSLAPASLRDFAMSVFNPTEVAEPLATVKPTRGIKRKRSSDSEEATPCPPKANFFGDVYPVSVTTETWVHRVRTPTLQPAPPPPLTIDTVTRLTVGAPPIQTALVTVPKVYDAVMEMTRSVRMMLEKDLAQLLRALDEFLDSLRTSLRAARKHIPFSHRRARDNARKIRAASGRFFASVGQKARENGEAFSVKMKAVKVGLSQGYKQKVVLRQKLKQRKKAWKAKKQTLLSHQGKFGDRDRDEQRKDSGFEVFRGYVI